MFDREGKFLARDLDRHQLHGVVFFLQGLGRIRCGQGCRDGRRRQGGGLGEKPADDKFGIQQLDQVFAGEFLDHPGQHLGSDGAFDPVGGFDPVCRHVDHPSDPVDQRTHGMARVDHHDPRGFLPDAGT